MFFPLLKTGHEKHSSDAVCENRSARVHAAIVQKFLVQGLAALETSSPVLTGCSLRVATKK